MTSKFPRDLYLAGGKVVKVNEVHYGLGKNFYRVSWKVGDREQGCVAEWTPKGFEEVTHDEWLAIARGVKKNDS